ncbi:MAG: NAD(P)H-dependent oxidoreductase [Saprospiraceae bacterium]|nr:NAD(P)H-dependent oxidoreductase [Saprospiraceae bacterium]
MITLICGTNRRGNETEQITNFIHGLLLKNANEVVKVYKLTDLPVDFIHPEMYSADGQARSISDIQDEYMLPASKFWFVFPEYNGGIPGILKLFLDAISVRKLKKTFAGKKACLTGVSTGRAGNLRGMDHLTNILNYLQVTVFPNRLPISSLNSLKDQDGEIKDSYTTQVLENQVKEFLNF